MMPNHPFHRRVWNFISRNISPELPGLHLLMDPACGKEGRHISLFSMASGTRVRYCDVDILIATDAGARVIIEIEESNVKPVQIFGKFFASAFSDCYYEPEQSKPRPILEPALFIQVLDSTKLKAESKKAEQWACLGESIRSILPCLRTRTWEYHMFFGESPERLKEVSEGIELVPTIQAFLEQKP